MKLLNRSIIVLFTLLIAGCPAPELSVSPSGDFSSAGPKGGPFAPSEAEYWVSADGGFGQAEWQASQEGDWCMVEPTGGSLSSGDRQKVIVSLAADSLDAGIHADVVTFVNQSNEQDPITRAVDLTVTAEHLLADLVAGWLRDLVPAEVAHHSTALAAEFKHTADELIGSSLVEPQEIIDHTTSVNRAVAGQDREKWLPFFLELRKTLNAFKDAGLLVTLDDHKKYWREIADGLER